jgi:hypothetical protein
MRNTLRYVKLFAEASDHLLESLNAERPVRSIAFTMLASLADVDKCLADVAETVSPVPRCLPSRMQTEAFSTSTLNTGGCCAIATPVNSRAFVEAVVSFRIRRVHVLKLIFRPFHAAEDENNAEPTEYPSELLRR